MDLYTLSQGYGSNFGLLRTGNSDFGLQQSFENSYARLDGMWIQDYIQAQQFALQTMPELLWSGRQNLGLGSAYVDYDFQGVDYLRKSAALMGCVSISIRDSPCPGDCRIMFMGREPWASRRPCTMSPVTAST